MANNIVQLTDYDNNNIYPIAGAAAQGSITKAMLDEGVFVGAELSDPGLTAYVATADIQDSAVTTAKIADLNVTTDKLATGAVTSDKIDYTTLKLPFPSSTIINNYGTVTASTSITPTKNCYLLGKAVVYSETAGRAYVSLPTVGTDEFHLAGIPYWSVTGATLPNEQVAFSLLLRKGQQYNITITGGVRMEALKTVEIVWA